MAKYTLYEKARSAGHPGRRHDSSRSGGLQLRTERAADAQRVGVSGVTFGAYAHLSSHPQQESS